MEDQRTTITNSSIRMIMRSVLIVSITCIQKLGKWHVPRLWIACLKKHMCTWINFKRKSIESNNLRYIALVSKIEWRVVRSSTTRWKAQKPESPPVMRRICWGENKPRSSLSFQNAQNENISRWNPHDKWFICIVSAQVVQLSLTCLLYKSVASLQCTLYVTALGRYLHRVGSHSEAYTNPDQQRP